MPRQWRKAGGDITAPGLFLSTPLVLDYPWIILDLTVTRKPQYHFYSHQKLIQTPARLTEGYRYKEALREAEK